MYEGDGDIRMTSTMELSIGNKLKLSAESR